MPEAMTLQDDESDWIDTYRKTRAETERLCSPLEADDYQLQSIVETSPPKWHLAHVSWFFNFFYPHDRWVFGGLRLADDP